VLPRALGDGINLSVASRTRQQRYRDTGVVTATVPD